MYKVDNARADYVTMNISKYQRSLYAQFRCGILPLEVEVGRYRSIDLPERLCKQCNLMSVEDEIHFLCDCPLYHDERELLFSQATISNASFSELDSLDKFVYLMSNHERAVILFVSHAYRKRQNYTSYIPANNI